MRKLAILLFLMCSMTADAQLDTSSVSTKINQLYESKQYKAAFDYSMQEAMKGNSYAQYMVGRMFYYGEGTNSDYSEAVNWLRKAVKKDNCFALILFWIKKLFSLLQI